MKTPPKRVDFGVPDAFGIHLFRVEIPKGRKAPVVIVEDYGYLGEQEGIPKEEERAVLERWVWSAIRDCARREFNGRLKAAGLKASRWRTGTNRVDRMLGRELCVLAWAAEQARPEEVPVICSKWQALRPEERWWLFSQTVAEAGLPDDKERGWRRALYQALSDGEAQAMRKRRRRPRQTEIFDLPMFKEI